MILDSDISDALVERAFRYLNDLFDWLCKSEMTRSDADDHRVFVDTDGRMLFLLEFWNPKTSKFVRWEVEFEPRDDADSPYQVKQFVRIG